MTHARALKAFVDRRFPGLYAALMGVRDRVSRAEPELQLTKALADPAKRAIDVGASNGLYTFWLLRRAATVLAFEPNPLRIPTLRSRFGGAMRSGRLRLETCALSDHAGAATLVVPTDAQGLASLELDAASGKAVSVTLRRLDEFDDQPVGFIKVDVEGHEVEVLRGGAGLIARDRPCILVESEERHRAGSLADIRALLEPMGYSGHFLLGDRLTPIERFDAATHQSLSALNAAGTHRLDGGVYVNNFMFVPGAEALARLRAAAGS